MNILGKRLSRMIRGRYTVPLWFAVATLSPQLGSAQTSMQIIDLVKAGPETVEIAKPTTVTFTVRVGVTTTLIPTSVNLLRYDAAGKLVANLGRMYDDQTHGDVLLGDGVFTTQIVLNETNPQTVFFRASVANKGVVKRVLSEPVSFNVTTNITAEQVLSSVADDIASNSIDNALRHFSGAAQNRDVLLALTADQRVRVSAALRAARLLEAKENLRTYEVTWPDDNGAPLALKIGMSKTTLGEWFIMSW